MTFGRTSKTLRLLAIWLAIAGVALRGLIPAGYMPATGEAARQGAVVVICPHGELSHHAGSAHDGQNSASSFEQCPFGAAAGPALPGVVLRYSFAPDTGLVRPAWSNPFHAAVSSLQLPPARGPPAIS